jgi:minimal CRISPR polymerase-like protein
MASLFIAGNTNQYTFANACLAAHFADRKSGGGGLTSVFVLHTPASEAFLSSRDEWKEHLRVNGLEPEVFVSFTVDLAGGTTAFIRANHIEGCLARLEQSDNIYVDLTNGLSVYKAFLTSVGYILGVRRQFLLDSSAVREGKATSEFWPSDLLERAYLELPDPALLDSVALSWLTDIRRFKAKAEEIADGVLELSNNFYPQRDGFISDVSHAVSSWLRGEKTNDGAALGGSVRYVGRAFEELIRTVYREIFANTKPTVSQSNMIREILASLETAAGDFEPDLLQDMAHLLRRLRNASTHKQMAHDFGKVMARLSIELFAACASYFSILHSRKLLSSPELGFQPAVKRVLTEGLPGRVYYFGLDGDDTGRQLEYLFQSSSRDIEFSRYSSAIDSALTAICKRVKASPLEGTVLFCSGDDLLFKAAYLPDAIENLRRIYFRGTGGLTCSVGFGGTPREAYVALKMAKASPGKNCVVGVQLVGVESSNGRSAS